MQNAGTPNYTGMDHSESDVAKGWDRVASVSMLELIALLWRQLPIMMIIFVVLFALGMFGVLSLKKEYTSTGRILVQFSEDYIYNPVLGTAGQGTAYSTDQMIQAEVGLFTAVNLKERVLKKVGMREIFPKLASQYAADPSMRSEVVGKAIESMTKSLGAFTAPNQPLISVSYRNEDPEVSAEVLNAIIDEYMIYRREVLLDAGTSQYGKERKTTEDKLSEINRELALFLNKHGSGDFVAERTAAGVRYAALSDLLLAAKARRREIDAGIRAREDRLASVPKEILQYTDDSSSGELATLQIQRAQLLAKYKPGSKPVQAIDAQIRKLEAYIADGRGKSQGVTRTGINLVHQTLQSEKLTLESDAQSIAERISVLGAQIAQVRRKQAKMQQLFPEYQRLAGKASVLQAAVVQFSTREEEYQARRNLAEQASNNIRVIERPIVPFKGKSMKKPAAILAFLFAGFSALMVGLGLVFSKVAKSAMRGGQNSRPNTREANSPPPLTPLHPGGGGFGQRHQPFGQGQAHPQGTPVGTAGATMGHPNMHAPGYGAHPGYGVPAAGPFGSYGMPMAANRPAPTQFTRPAAAPGSLPVIANIGPKTGLRR
jgi:uncharacterized protein involved in exopolysaccharide biosynthesis